MADFLYRKCKGCGGSYHFVKGLVPPPSCGEVKCRFVYGPWGMGKSVRLKGATDREWEGRARMAVVRQECGIPLDDLDRQALERCPEPRSLFAVACSDDN